MIFLCICNIYEDDILCFIPKFGVTCVCEEDLAGPDLVHGELWDGVGGPARQADQPAVRRRDPECDVVLPTTPYN